jgi:hypothetical protein
MGMSIDHVHEEQNLLNTFQSPSEPGPEYQSTYDACLSGSAGTQFTNRTVGLGVDPLPPLNVLLLGVSDPSTLLKTISRARRHPTRKINVRGPFSPSGGFSKP